MKTLFAAFAVLGVVCRADILPSFTTEISEVPSTAHPLGLRGGDKI